MIWAIEISESLVFSLRAVLSVGMITVNKDDHHQGKWPAGIFIALNFLIFYEASRLYIPSFFIDVHSGVFAGSINLLSWLVALLLVGATVGILRVHIPLGWHNVWWGVLVGIPSLFAMLYATRSLIPVILHVPDFKPLIAVGFVEALRAGVTEEFVFRGVSLSLFQRVFRDLKHPLFWSIFASSVLFASAHIAFNNFFNFSVLAAIGAFGAGILYATLTICTHSIWPGIILHTLEDFLPNISSILNPITQVTADTFQPFNLSALIEACRNALFLIALAIVIYTVWHRYSKPLGKASAV